MAQQASIYLRRGKLFISPDSQTTSKFWIEVDPILVIDQADHVAIAEALRASLEASRTGVPTPPASADLTGPMLDVAGVKSWRAFVREAKCVGARLNGGVVTLTPYRRVDSVGNFVPVSESKRVVPFSSEELGEAVLSALASIE